MKVSRRGSVQRSLQPATRLSAQANSRECLYKKLCCPLGDMQPQSESGLQSVQSHHSNDTSLQQLEDGWNQIASFHHTYRKDTSDEEKVLNYSPDDRV